MIYDVRIVYVDFVVFVWMANRKCEEMFRKEKEPYVPFDVVKEEKGSYKDFSDKLFHIHAKDVRIDHDKLNEVGIMAPQNEWHTPKLPGMGDVDWGKFSSILTDAGFDGSVCVEVEDRAYEGSLEKRKTSLRQAHTYLRQFIPKIS